MTSTITSSLGFPRIGPGRGLKFALEAFWSGKTDRDALLSDGSALRAATWSRQRGLGIRHIPSNDFSFYDHVLDTSAMVGAIPPGYGWTEGDVPLETYFALARGSSAGTGGRAKSALAPLEMTKWFDTNYHYMVPELSKGQEFRLSSTKVIEEFREAKSLGIVTRPVILGPLTYLLLSKSKNDDLEPLSLLSALLPVYATVLRYLSQEGAEWVQIDEPALVLDLDDRIRTLYAHAYKELADAAPSLKILVATYFGALGENLDTALQLPVSGLHLDIVRAPQQLDAALARLNPAFTLSLGVIDGRNIWRSDLDALLQRLEPIVHSDRRIMLAPSCSLIHCPLDLALETKIDPELKGWLAFAVQKLEELAVLAMALDGGRSTVAEELQENARTIASRQSSSRVTNHGVRERLAGVTVEMMRRDRPFQERRTVQRRLLNLPPLPTTAIGSFPQTAEVRKARAAHTEGSMSDADYESFLKKQIESAVRWQEEIDLDVLVHGEFERNDMVQYFGEQLSGFAFTDHAWVQSYGSRCVRPPIIYGDVSRPAPMTVAWWSYSQALTSKPMKAMITGPVTILQWSFVRDDQPRSHTCFQIALALRDEVDDLERAGAKIIQIDEAALREGLPLRRVEWQEYLDWAVEAFRLCSSGVRAETQIHTHMCYSEFNDIITSIAAMDADVISVEAARSKMELLEAFSNYKYPNEIGPGIYDIHAPRIPNEEEMFALLRSASERLAIEQLWVNPDCGLKTRRWSEVKPALANMVSAAKHARETLRRSDDRK